MGRTLVIFNKAANQWMNPVWGFDDAVVFLLGIEMSILCEGCGYFSEA